MNQSKPASFSWIAAIIWWCVAVFPVVCGVRMYLDDMKEFPERSLGDHMMFPMLMLLLSAIAVTKGFIWGIKLGK